MGVRLLGESAAIELADRAEEAARRPGNMLADAECPECGGQTSGEGVVCWRCR